ncbi:MAG TPA: nicotinate phosphoribosyltransferase [Eubacteriales bacterium]|nr:nicotinate phosphoribosyltransferase [Eubacteriales bacterium]
MDGRNLTMLTDYYELTMMNAYYLKRMTDTVAVFDVFFRAYDESNYVIAAGLQQAVEYLLNLRFTDEDIKYLESTNGFDKGFLGSLKDFKFTGNIYAVEEGTVVFPTEPLLIVEAPINQAQLVEGALLNILNFQTLIATKAARICRATDGGSVLEFGLRRAQAPDASIYGARAAVIGGCDTTSNVLAAQMFGVPPAGTHAHSWVMAFPTEIDAFRAYAEIYPDKCLLLVDTYDTLKSGVPNAIKVFDELKAKGIKPFGIRLDSGDLAYLSKQARKMLDDAGYKNAKICVSGDLDEYVIQSLKLQGACIDIYGVGTKMITSSHTPSLGGVYKLSALKDGNKYIPKMKVSDNPIKTTNPGRKSVYRLIDNHTKKALADVITLYDEKIDDNEDYKITSETERWKTMILTDFTAVPLLKNIIIGGKVVYDFPTLKQIKAKTKENLDAFWDEYKRNEKPQLFKVDLSDKLYSTKQKLIAATRGEIK